MIITKDDLEINNLATLLQINIKGDGSELFDYNLPTPNNYKRSHNDLYTIEYLIKGVFWTALSAEFLNDILLRFNLSMSIIEIQTKTVKTRPEALELKEFSSSTNLKSLSRESFIPRANKYEDSVFWGLKLFVEHYISREGFMPYNTLLSYGTTHYYDHTKDFSTLKAKCRSIWNWYNDRDWKPTKYERKYTNEELKMTRQEHIRQVNDNRKEESRRKVINTITGMFAETEYKKPNGKWNITKLSKDLKLSRPTVIKYIAEFEAE